MRIAIVTLGSRGDVQPYIALGLGLRAAGHAARLVTHAEYAPLVASYGLELAPLTGNVGAILKGEAGLTFTESGSNPVAFARGFSSLLRPLLADLVRDCWHACQDAEAILYSIFGALVAGPVLEKSPRPHCAAYAVPATPTGAYASPSFPAGLRLGPVFNRLSYGLGEQMY